MKSTNYKHLSYRQRGIIENCLNQGYKLIDIANTLGRDPRGIKQEIFNKRQISTKKAKENACGKINKCKKIRLCDDCTSGLCKYCKHHNCNLVCKEFIELPKCKHIDRYPYVCN